MSRDKEATETSGVGDWFSLEPYKRSQGRITRQMTFFALLAIIAVGAYQLFEMIKLDHGVYWAWGVFLGIVLVGAWVCYRAVNLPHFADFLIAVEAEMHKVTWPTWDDVQRATVVVIIVMFTLAVVLFFFDALFQVVFNWLGVVAK